MKSPTAKRRKNKSSIEGMKSKAFKCIIIPYAVFMIIFKAFPFLWGIFISFTNYTGFNLDNLSVVGFNNYVRFFSDSGAIASMGRSALIAVIVVPISMTICIIMSLLLNNAAKGIGIYRTICYLPAIIPGVAIAMMWQGMFAKTDGFFNQVIALFGGKYIDWLGYAHVRTSLIIMLLWSAGNGVLTNIAAMKCISPELYEAADLEGIGPVRKTLKITIPLISNMLYMNLITGMIAMLQLFAEPVLLTGGELTSMPIKPVYTYIVHVYQQIFVNMRYGYGLAMVWVIFAVIILLTMFAEKTSKLWVYSEVD